MQTKYKNYILEPDSHQSPETQKWSATIRISKQDDSGALHILPFHIRTIFNTQKEADDSSLKLGIDIIDGNYPDKLPF